MIQVPHTYSEWVTVLELLRARRQDEEVLEAMKGGSLEWQSGVAERFTKRLLEVVNDRMNAASDRFQKEMGRAGTSEGAIVQALLALRKELGFLVQALTLSVLPEKEHQKYVQLILDQADIIQHSLEESAKGDRSGKLASLVRNHKVNQLQGGQKV